MVFFGGGTMTTRDRIPFLLDFSSIFMDFSLIFIDFSSIFIVFSWFFFGGGQ